MLNLSLKDSCGMVFSQARQESILGNGHCHVASCLLVLTQRRSKNMEKKPSRATERNFRECRKMLQCSIKSISEVTIERCYNVSRKTCKLLGQDVNI